MHTLVERTRGLSLLINVNWDRLFYAAAIVVALWAGSAIGTFLLN